MSELMQIQNSHYMIRWKLLTGTSILALTAHIALSNLARAEDSDRPTAWIELGGQLNRLQGGQEIFSPPLMDGRPSTFDPSQKFEKMPSHSIDEFGKLSFQPGGTDWIFSASIQYGRSTSSKHNVQQTNPLPTFNITTFKYPIAQRFADTRASNDETHAIVDFQVGKDVGFGLFGRADSSSSISVGVRFAQFSSKSNFALKSDPDWHFSPQYVKYVETKGQKFHSNSAAMIAQRSFHGIGPSVSWKSSVPLTGKLENGEIGLDWGISGAVLFGRQKARTHHQSTARYEHYSKYNFGHSAPPTTARFPATPDHARSRTVIVPNIGGFAGLSFKYSHAKVSFGYRADFFFGAMDGGIDTRKNEAVGFHGPFATVSIGLGG